MNTAFRNILAIIIAILPVNIFMIWYRLNQAESFSANDMILYPLLIGGSIGIVILLLNKHLIKSTFKDTFNSGKGAWYWDILIGLGLTIIYFAMFYADLRTFYMWWPNTDNPERIGLVNTVIRLSKNPLLLTIWFGPVLWVGIALFEELSRVFMLKCLWNLKNNVSWHIAVILLTSTLIGFVHIYQGTAGIISIGLKSLVMCFYFYRYRRLLPLIISHGLYDGIQFAYFVVHFQ